MTALAPIPAWRTPPSPAELRRHSAPHLIVCLADKQLPDWSSDATFQAALRCVQFVGANVLRHVLPHQTIWLMPPTVSAHLADYFGEREISWQTESVPQHPVFIQKAWFRQPETALPEHIIIIGAGIAGACTAHELAQRGVRVTVLDSANQPAHAASGNRQGLLYAKISPHDTAQTELLLCAYGYARYSLENQLSNQKTWGATGVLHLNHNEAETRRNTALAQQTWHQHLYRGVSEAAASELAGVMLATDGLFWQQGAWLNPPAWIDELLAHDLIDLKLNCDMTAAAHDGERWHIHTSQEPISGSHLIFCTGAGSLKTPIIQQFPFQIIRGQTSLARATSFSGSLKTALSGASYIAPAWENVHTFGATFLPHDADDTWRENDDIHNQIELKQLNSKLYEQIDFSGSLKGHAALRCDAHDHLPVVGALGEPHAMRQVYAKLALDKHYRLDSPCPFYPNAFVNTAHGSRGLTTAPISAAYLAALICGEPVPFSRRLQAALHPNRLIIRQITHHQR